MTLLRREYYNAWRAFRAVTCESDVIAETCRRILADTRTAIPSRGLKILDLGCGDGSVISQFVRGTTLISGCPLEIHLVDSGEQILGEALAKVRDATPSARIFDWPYDTPSAIPLLSQFSGFHLILVSHLVYYIDLSVLRAVAELLAPAGLLIVVTNSPISLFVKLWDKFAPHAANRVRLFYEQSLPIPLIRKESFSLHLPLGRSNRMCNKDLLHLLAPQASFRELNYLEKELDKELAHTSVQVLPIDILAFQRPIQKGSES